VDVAGAVEGRADAADATVHHVRGGDDVDAGLCADDCLAFESRDRLVVHDVARRVDNAVLAMRRVRIERGIRDDAEVRKFPFERGDGTRDESVRIRRFAAVRRLHIGRDDREERECGDAQRHALLRPLEQPVERMAFDARHGRHGFGAVLTFHDEHRINQVVCRQ